jgi:hypothetical protein
MATQRIDLSQFSSVTHGQRYYSPRPEVLELSLDGSVYKFHPGFGTIAPLHYRDPKRQVSAKDLYDHFFGSDGRSGTAALQGVRPAFGDSRDEAIAEEAKEAYENAEYASDLALKLGHMDRIQKQREAGVPPSVPSKAVMAAMQRIRERELKTGQSMAFTCPHCAWPSANDAERKAHIFEMHPEQAQPLTQFVGVDGQMEAPEFARSPRMPVPSPEQEAKIKALEGKLDIMAEALKALADRKKPGPKPKPAE